MHPLVTLHRYFIAANKMRILFDRTLRDPDIWKKFEGMDPFSFVNLMHADDYGVFMFYWYGGLYVVIEGYRELRQTNAKIDALLASPNVEFLRRCRNGVFHFQTSYLDERLVAFMGQPDSASWIRELTEAFSEFFLEAIPGQPKDRCPAELTPR